MTERIVINGRLREAVDVDECYHAHFVYRRRRQSDRDCLTYCPIKSWRVASLVGISLQQNTIRI